MTADLSKQRKVSSITLPGLINPHDLALDRQFAMTLARGLEVLRALTAKLQTVRVCLSRQCPA